MAWAGSAPGPVSPRDWLEGIYDYAVRVMNPEKIFLDCPPMAGTGGYMIHQRTLE